MDRERIEGAPKTRLNLPEPKLFIPPDEPLLTHKFVVNHL